jgi:diadenosine tetraphosphate (Ap4A) HIT family hydrolase
MKNKLPKPNVNSIIYNDSKLYVCLANYPLVYGHTVVVWKKKVRDLHLLKREDYIYLMNKMISSKEIDSFILDLFMSAQKIGSSNGPFLKIS